MCSTLSPSLTPPRSVTGLRPPSSSSQEEVLWNLARHSRGFFALESASLPAPPRLADGQGAFQRERDSRRWRRGSLREGRLSMRECEDRTSGIKAKLSFVSHIVNVWTEQYVTNKIMYVDLLRITASPQYFPHMACCTTWNSYVGQVSLLCPALQLDSRQHGCDVITWTKYGLVM